MSQTELSSKEIPIFKNYPGTDILKKPSSVNMSASGNTPLSDKMLKMLNSQFPLHRKNSNTVSFSVNLVLRTCTFNSNLGPQRNFRCSAYNNFGPWRTRRLFIVPTKPKSVSLAFLLLVGTNFGSGNDNAIFSSQKPSFKCLIKYTAYILELDEGIFQKVLSVHWKVKLHFNWLQIDYLLIKLMWERREVIQALFMHSSHQR